MNKHEKALMSRSDKKVNNLGAAKFADRKGVKAKLPYKFLKQTGAEEEK